MLCGIALSKRVQASEERHTWRRSLSISPETAAGHPRYARSIDEINYTSIVALESPFFNPDPVSSAMSSRDYISTAVEQNQRNISRLSLPDPQASSDAQSTPKEYRSVAKTAVWHRPWQRGKGDIWVSVLEPEPLIWRPDTQQLRQPVNLWVRLSLQQYSKSTVQPIECCV
jgi:hypothetical protein